MILTKIKGTMILTKIKGTIIIKSLLGRNNKYKDL